MNTSSLSPPVHPGKILAREFMAPHGLTKFEQDPEAMALVRRTIPLPL